MASSLSRSMIAAAACALAAVAAPPAHAEPLLNVRLGFPVAGSATLRTDCDSSGGFTCPDSVAEEEGDNGAAFVLGVDLLWGLSDHLRLGGGVMIVPGASVDLDDGAEYELGTELPVLFVAEPFLPISSKSTLFARLQGGAVVLLPTDDFQDELDLRQDDCDALKEQLPGASCEASRLAWGWTVGAGGGWSYTMKQVNVRAELLFTYHTLQLVHQRIDVNTASFSGAQLTDQRVSGTRLWLVAGLEFDL